MKQCTQFTRLLSGMKRSVFYSGKIHIYLSICSVQELCAFVCLPQPNSCYLCGAGVNQLLFPHKTSLQEEKFILQKSSALVDLSGVIIQTSISFSNIFRFQCMINRLKAQNLHFNQLKDKKTTRNDHNLHADQNTSTCYKYAIGVVTFCIKNEHLLAWFPPHSCTSMCDSLYD